jgi:SEC-C motif-containing protein
MTEALADPCPCGLRADYARCCGRYHAGAEAPTAELLMRSRYSAFARGDVTYLERTWHPTTRPRRIRLGLDRSWTGLEIVAAEAGELLDREGTVEFRAHHRDRDGDDVLHEVSRFERVDGRWRYLSGTTP